MFKTTSICRLAISALLLCLPACITPREMKIARPELIAKLEHEMLSNTQWLRIHAAEGLLDNGETNKIADLFRAEADSATAPYRIGVWRVLARSTTGMERNGYIERIRAVLHTPEATDRISAAESLGKLDAASRADRGGIVQWLKAANDSTAPFPQWLLVLSANNAEREQDEAGLAQFIRSNDPIARLRAAFALGRLDSLSSNSVAFLRDQLAVEATDSIARIYLITALLLHEKDPEIVAELEAQLAPYVNGKANEQLELGIVTGLRRKREEVPLLLSLLDNPEADARIGAANGLLKFSK